MEPKPQAPCNQPTERARESERETKSRAHWQSTSLMENNNNRQQTKLDQTGIRLNKIRKNPNTRERREKGKHGGPPEAPKSEEMD